MSRSMGNWHGSSVGRAARAKREAVEAHAGARIASALRGEPGKIELKEMLAEAARNTAALQPSKEV